MESQTDTEDDIFIENVLDPLLSPKIKKGKFDESDMPD